MTDYLVFRLYGPMASWGDIAVGETRQSHSYPSKSAAMGIVAAALGIRREDDASHRRLVEGYGFAVCVENMGAPLSDYHTAQVPPANAGRFATRRDELAGLPREELKTILSRRDYRTDALAIVLLWARSSAPYLLSRLAEALSNPVYALYLGRKSCPQALPLEAQVVSAESLKETLKMAKFSDFNELQYLPRIGTRALYWEDGAKSGLPAQHTFQRRDVPLSRKRWQFDVRHEHHAPWPAED